MGNIPIAWVNNAPKSPRFDDYYFSSEDGLNESKYVFLKHNRLPERFVDSPRICVGELGFGTGLNFFLTWQQWLTAGRPCALEYVSFEQYPLGGDDIRHALCQWPSLTPLVDTFLQQYQRLWPGIHRIHLSEHQLTFSLHLGDANATLPQFCGHVDAWFLDGFSPIKNPEMWNEQLLQDVANRTNPGGTFSTFSASSLVKKRLEASGFNVTKAPGFGPKREMLWGQKHSTPHSPLPPWFNASPVATRPHTVAVIGAGLAGCSTAHRLAQAGLKVTVFERGHIANDASGNPAGLFQPQLSADHNRHSQYHLQAFRALLNTLNETRLDQSVWKQTGIYHPATNDNSLQRYKEIAETFEHFEGLVQWREDPSRLAPGLFFPLAGWINPALWCSHLLKHPNITTHEQTQVTRPQRYDHQWHVNQQTFDVCVLANAYQAGQWLPFLASELRSVPGQLNRHPLKPLNQQYALSFGHYLIPNADQHTYIGASFELHGDETNGLNPDVFQENIRQLSVIDPQIQELFENDPLDGRRSNRCVSKDHMPFIGPAICESAYHEHYHDLHHGKHWKRYPEATVEPGLFISTGHGARGIVSSALASEVIASLVLGHSLPITADVYQTIHPARGLIRTLKRKAST